MADITFKFKRGSSGGSSPSGLTHGELAVNTTDNRLFVGSVTGSVNAINNRFFTGISTPSYPIEGDRWYTGTVEKFYYSGNWVTAGGASGSSGSSFDPTQLLVFNSGVSGSGGATFAGGTRFYGGAIVQSGGLSVTGGATITGGVALYGTITVNGAPISSGIANVPLASSSATGVASFGNEFVVSALGAVSLTSNYVKSFNGSTGTVSFAVPLASSSATGVASFGNEFVVSAAGAVGLTSNYVKSFNGSTGTVSFAVPLASSSATGVASFGNEFVVSAAGAVSLTSNNVISVNGRTGNVVLPLASSSATGVASFGNEFVVSAAGAVSLTSNNVISVNGRTGNVVLPLASSSATGVASFGNEFVVSNLGAVGLTSNYVKSVNGSTGAVLSIATTGSNTFTGLQTLNAGLTTNYIYVSNGATFANGLNLLGVGGGYQTLSSDASNNLIVNSWNYQSYKVGGTEKLYIGAAGISATGLYVSSGATFAGTVSAILNTIAQPNITSVGTLTRLDVGSGGISSAGGITGTINTAAQPNITSVGTLTSLSSSGLVTASGGITSNHLYVTNGVTFAGTSVHTGLGTFNAGLTTTHLHVTNGATFAGTVSAVSISAALVGNASTATTLATARKINETSFNGSSDIIINQMYREDNRIISPSAGSTGYSRFVFTAWNNNGNNAPYADAIHFRTYTDSSGGNDNLLMLRKDAIGMRLWQQTYGSTTPYSVYKDVAFIQDVVTSFNGLTGAVSGVTTSAANTFTALNTFNAGISVASGATFTGTSFFTGTETKASFNGGLVTNTLNVIGGVTFGGNQGTYHAGLGTFNAGITSNHLYVTSGVTFAGTNGIFLAMNASNPLGTTGLSLVSDSSASGALKISTPSGWVTIGPQNTSYSHFYTDRAKFYFSRPIQVSPVSGQSTLGSYSHTDPLTIGTPNDASGTLFTRITVLTGPNSDIGGYVGIGTTTPQAKLDISGNAIVRGDLTVLGNIPYSFVSIGGLTSPYRTTNFGSNVLNNYYAPLSVSGPIFVRGGTGATNGTSYMLGRFVFDGGFDSNFSAGQTAAEFRGNVYFNVGNNRDSILFSLPNGGGYETNNLRFTNPFTTWGMDVEENGIRISSPFEGGSNSIGTRNYLTNGGIGRVLPASGITDGAYALGTMRPGTGQTGYAFLHLLHGKTGPGTTSNAAIKIIRANNTQAFVDYAGRFNGAQFSIISDVALKSNIVKYTESTVSSVPIPTGKWLPDIRNFFQPYTFTYNNAPELGTKYGYLAQELANIDSKVAGSSFLSSEGNTGDSLTAGTTNYFINQDQLLFGAVEAIRELDAEVCRLWKTSSAPPPSRAKDNDLWFDPTTSKMYLRFNDGTQSQWIQPS